MNLATYIPVEEQSIEDLAWMREALVMAEEALANEEVPVGCVFVENGQAIARARNRTNEWRNATLHAELEAIDHLLPHHPPPLSSITLYVTVEPCVMCASALRQIGIGRVVYGCGNDRFGGCGSVIDVNNSPLLQIHQGFVAEGGYYREEAIMLLRRFYMSENQNAPNPKKKNTRVLKTEIAPPPSTTTSTPNTSRPSSTAPSSSSRLALPTLLQQPSTSTLSLALPQLPNSESVPNIVSAEEKEKEKESETLGGGVTMGDVEDEEEEGPETVQGSTTAGRGRQGMPIGSTLAGTPRGGTPLG